MWTHLNGYLDEDLWVLTTHKIASGQSIQPTDLAFGYPGTTFTLPASFLVNVGMSEPLALKLTLALEVSIVIASIVTLAYILAPKSLWYVACGGFFMFHPLLFDAVPPSVIVAPLIVLIILFVLYIRNQGPFISKTVCSILGIILGLSLAARLDVTAVVCFVCLVYLWFFIRHKLWLLISVAALVFFILNPHILASPATYISEVYSKIHVHYSGDKPSEPLVVIFRRSPLGILSFIYALILIFIMPKLLPIPRSFALLLVCLTAFLGILFSTSHYHPSWYFHPLFFIWEAFFPLFLITLIDHATISRSVHWLTQSKVKIFLITLLIASQVTSLFLWHFF
jgi:hypothetical protein